MWQHVAELGRALGLHYATISRIVTTTEHTAKDTA